MKIRCDFVTNSSSSSFIVAKKEDFELSDEMKEEIVDYVLNLIFQRNKVTGPDLEYLKEDDYSEEILKALEENKEIYQDYIEFERDYLPYFICTLYNNLFNILNQSDDFTLIQELDPDY